MVFEQNETVKYVDIAIIDDNEWEPDEIFFIKLSLDTASNQDSVLGRRTIHEATIINDDGK